MPVNRPRHPDKDLEELLRLAERQGWRVTKGRGYFLARCPCGGCQESVHLTPSNPNYRKNKLNKMAKCPSWR
jgi:hypothetical protein